MVLYGPVVEALESRMLVLGLVDFHSGTAWVSPEHPLRLALAFGCQDYLAR